MVPGKVTLFITVHCYIHFYVRAFSIAFAPSANNKNPQIGLKLALFARLYQLIETQPIQLFLRRRNWFSAPLVRVSP
jgi:hypothetical protein